ncbi:MAG: efflux RND transporter permease subunit [Calditrichaeota bacterium]|nr:efflux RND transporter permease subunit [Calditrichota bacterium]MCB9369905.1 efflux RND transporter permease subunit [Calditrichota bacterium]
MFDFMIKQSLTKRFHVLLAALVLLIGGTYVALQMPIDIFPDLTAPTVTVMADVHGFAPEEIESLVAFPIESSMNGATGVRRVRSSISTGMAIIWVEFNWGTDILQARQVVTERLQSMMSSLPPGMEPPILAPISSIMGEVMLISVQSDSLLPMDLRSYSDNILRKRLLAIPGVAQVIPIGMQVKQYQIVVKPEKLLAYNVSLEEVVEAAKLSSENTTGGYLLEGGREHLIRGIGRVESVDDIGRTVVTTRNGVPILIDQVADVKVDGSVALGNASVDGTDAVILSVQKQPGANTLELTKRIETAAVELQRLAPADVKVRADVFRQANFIEVAVRNVMNALRDGAILVTIILLLFLGNVRTTFISLMAIPISLVVAVIALKLMGSSVNTMTLGGLAIAIGLLVDDAIIDVENVFRRLRLNALKPASEKRSVFEVIYRASLEVRKPIVVATLIIIAVFAPLFFLSGVEGRLLQPLGASFIISILASLFVAVTVVPALSYYLLGKLKSNQIEHESLVVRKLKQVYKPTVDFALKNASTVITVSVFLLVGSVVLYSRFGQAFLPEFNEGSLTVISVSPPGTSLAESNEIGEMIEQIVLSQPGVAGVARRTGRGEMDEHALGSNATEMECRLEPDIDKEHLLEQLRTHLAMVPGTFISIGQPISHRIDHMLSGTQAAIAVKLYGEDLTELRNSAELIKKEMEQIEGIVDLSVEPQIEVPQLRIKMNREAMSQYGVKPVELAEAVETAYNGTVVGRVMEGQFAYEMIVRYDPSAKADTAAIVRTPFHTPTGHFVMLRDLAYVYSATGPSMISRENVSRKIVIQSNVAGRSLGDVVGDVQSRVAANVNLPDGYYVSYGGQFESAESAGKVIGILTVLAILVIIILLFTEFGNLRDALLVMVNLPLALIGGVAAIGITDGIVSIASMVGFVTLFGIAARNGILLISHYHHLMEEEGVSFREAIVQGSIERMSPILMTALCAGLALIPLALGGGQPGKEIETPMAIVILGGLISSTALNMVVVPALYLKFGRKRKLVTNR